MRRGLSTDVWTALFVWAGGLLGSVVGCGDGAVVTGSRADRSCVMDGRCRLRRRMGSSLRRVRLFMVTVVRRITSVSLRGEATGCSAARRLFAVAVVRRVMSLSLCGAASGFLLRRRSEAAGVWSASARRTCRCPSVDREGPNLPSEVVRCSRSEVVRCSRRRLPSSS